MAEADDGAGWAAQEGAAATESPVWLQYWTEEAPTSESVQRIQQGHHCLHEVQTDSLTVAT